MNKLYKNDSGFGAVEALLILIIAGLIGFTGWFVWQSKNKFDNSEQIITSSPQVSSSSSVCNTTNTSRQCIDTASAKKTVLSKLPADLQKVALAEIKKQAPVCVKGEQLIDFNGKAIDPEVSYAPIGSAIIVIGCGEGSAGLFAKNKDGQWKFVEQTQFAFNCDSIFSNPVPKQLLEFGPKAECLDSANNLQPYDTELNKRFL